MLGINTEFQSSHKIIEETFRYIKIIELVFL